MYTAWKFWASLPISIKDVHAQIIKQNITLKRVEFQEQMCIQIFLKYD